MRRWCILLLVGLMLAGTAWGPTPQAVPGCEAVAAATTRGGASATGGGRFSCNVSSGSVAVSRVIDGDTIVVQGNVHVRYTGMDTPEVFPQEEAFSREATEANRRLVEGKVIRQERDVSDTHRFGRWLRYVYVGQVMVNTELVREGYARAVAYPPDVRHDPCFKALEAEAREERRGMWGRGGR